MPGMNTIIDSTGESLVSAMLRAPKQSQQERGYADTLAEICQQPETWIRTANTVDNRREEIYKSTDGCRAIVLTGSGSSQFASECIHPLIQSSLDQPAL